MLKPTYPELAKAAFAYPAIDNHAHPFLKEANRASVPFEGLISEAQGEALSNDSVHTLACYRAASQLSKLFGLKGDEATWESVKEKRASLDYMELCKLCMEPTGIQCILIDDGLGGVKEWAEEYQWHDQFTTSPTKRIVRLEVLAQDLLEDILVSHAAAPLSMSDLMAFFTDEFTSMITINAADDQVAGFKSVACYRTGLDIGTSCTPEELQKSLANILNNFSGKGSLRFADKTFNDFIVRLVLAIAGTYKKPVQFHTGLGDNDIRLAKSSPSFMQPVIEAFPDTPFVLLHSSYPYTRDAGYLAAVYKNVYLDFGEIFPFVSGEGQRAVIRQMFELCPANKLLWSSECPLF
ncbi:amidohydrolase-domain-containing protein [Hygrophoropsis aurantiaca]|uniref:Amidohydrolase-domain-containing protein n=1 Tax=Hygrophoropsis aurantiaca TaxID=72124 RepID=A0ACB8AA72_9AGAM|nr:amidohydrolase-domain-containing protein [Hygrophoropsis aurantiaca]